MAQRAHAFASCYFFVPATVMVADLLMANCTIKCYKKLKWIIGAHYLSNFKTYLLACFAVRRQRKSSLGPNILVEIILMRSNEWKMYFIAAENIIIGLNCSLIFNIP